MKKIILTLSLAFTASCLSAQWDSVKTQEPINNILKISPFHFVEGTFLLSYERMLSSDQTSSLMLSLGLHSRETYDQPEPSFGTVEELQYRYYVAPPQNQGVGGGDFFYFKGFYAGPFVYHRYRSQTRTVFDWILQSNVDVNEQVNEMAGGVLLGVQVALGNRFFIDFYTGGGVKKSFGVVGDPSQDAPRNAVDVGYNGVIPKIGFQIGIGI
jgi:hypothetical protein